MLRPARPLDSGRRRPAARRPSDRRGAPHPATAEAVAAGSSGGFGFLGGDRPATAAAGLATALALILVLSPGHGRGAANDAAASGGPTGGGPSVMAALPATAVAAAPGEIDAILANIEDRARLLRVQADAGAELRRRAGEAEARARERDAARAEAADLRRALRDAEARIVQLTAQRDDAERRAEALTEELDAALTEAAWLDREMGSAWQAVEAQTAALQETEAARAAAEAEAARLSARLRDIRARLERVHETLAPPAGAAGSEGRVAAAAAPPPPLPSAPSTEPPAAIAVEDEAAGPAVEVEVTVETAAAVSDDRNAAGVATAATERRPPPRELGELGARRTARGLEMIVPGDKLFGFDSDEIRPAASGVLARMGRVLEFYRDRDVLIVGHTDALGDPVYNRHLSERRARAVRNYFLGGFDLDRGRLRVAGLGASEPIASNGTRDGRQRNRRVEVVIRD